MNLGNRSATSAKLSQPSIEAMAATMLLNSEQRICVCIRCRRPLPRRRDGSSSPSIQIRFSLGLAQPQAFARGRLVDLDHLGASLPYIHDFVSDGERDLSAPHPDELPDAASIYLKARFVCGSCHEHRNIRSLHSQIDRLLLSEFAVKGHEVDRDCRQEEGLNQVHV